jgi:Lrp/AsnC family transcriptional regulator
MVRRAGAWQGGRMSDLDATDRAILRLISVDASLSLNEIAERVHLTATPCWKRIKRMEEAGIIKARVAVLDADRLGLPVSVFVSVETSDHSAEWLGKFAQTVASTPEIVGAWRRSGDVIVADIAAYDGFYRRLIAAVPLRNVSSRFAMERMKDGALPI